jgi:hypothetical protein
MHCVSRATARPFLSRCLDFPLVLLRDCQMYWREELKFRIAPKCGPLRVMDTLLDASRAMTQDLPGGHLKRPHWLQAGQAVFRAADTGSPSDIEVATELLLIALEAHGWMQRDRMQRLRKLMGALDQQLRDCIVAARPTGRKPTFTLVPGTAENGIRAETVNSGPKLSTLRLPSSLFERRRSRAEAKLQSSLKI